jgi:hypothetical protein
VRRRSFLSLPLLVVVATTGCAQIEKEGRAVDDLVAEMHSEDFTQRQAATSDLLTRDPVSLRYIVIPRLALESARVPLEVSSADGNIVRGRVTGGSDQTLELEVTERVARGAVVRFTFGSIKVIRLFSP